MKLRDKFIELKQNNKESIVFIKSGTFYLTYDADAEIVKSILSYKIENGKLGFPINSLSKVLDNLEQENISYYVYNGEEDVCKTFENNNYMKKYSEYKKIEYKESTKKLLFERINFLLESNPENYDKIRKFIDEL